MTKQDLKKIMDDNDIFDNEIGIAIGFVRDLLEFRANEIEQEEPYATNTIKRLRDAEYEVLDLMDYIEELRE